MHILAGIYTANPACNAMVVGSIETSSATWTRGLVEGRTMDNLLDKGSAVTILSAEVWNELKCVAG